MIKIGVADDHDLVRGGIIELLEKNNKCSVTIEASNGKKLLNLLALSNNLPDVLIIDISMPVLDGPETVKEIKKIYPHIKIVMLSYIKEKNAILNVFNLGVNGFVSKSDPLEMLEAAVHEVVETGYFLNCHFCNNTTNEKDWIKYSFIGEVKFSKREFEFIQYAAASLKYEEIAEKMNISNSTINNYRETVYKKCDVYSRQELVLYAIRNGLIYVN